MAAGNNIPERLINFRVYTAGNDLLGIATVELPELTAMSETTSGAGIAGEVETPTIGQYESMTTTISWRTIEKKAMALAIPGAHVIEVRGSQQVYDSANGQYKSVPVRVTMKVSAKTTSLGSFEPNATTDTEQEFEVLYIKMFVDNVPTVEIDKFNSVVKFFGVNILDGVNKDLGINGSGSISSLVNSAMSIAGL